MIPRDFSEIVFMFPFLASTLEPREWRAMCLTCHDWRRGIVEPEFTIDWGYDNDRPLRCAAKQGLCEYVRFLLSKPVVNPAALDNTPLTLAAVGGHAEIVEQLLSLPHVVPRIEALAGAMIKRHRKVADLIVSSGKIDFSIDPSIEGIGRITRASKETGIPVMLILSIEYGFPVIFQKVYDIKAHDASWFPFLFKTSSQKECHDIVFFLLKRHVTEHTSRKFPLDTEDVKRWCRQWLKSENLTLEVWQSSQPVISAYLDSSCLAKQCIIRDRCDFLAHLIDEMGCEVSLKFLIDASRYGALTCMKFLVQEKGLDPLSRGQKVFRTAIEKRQEVIVDWLLTDVPGIDPSLNDNIPIRLASQSGSAPLVSRLLDEPGVSAYACGNLPLRQAAEQGYTAIVNLLLSRGGSRVDPTCSNNAPLVEACAGGHADCVAALLSDSRVRVTPEAVLASVPHGRILALLVERDASALQLVEDKTALARGLIVAGQMNYLGEGVLDDSDGLRDIVVEFFRRMARVKSIEETDEVLSALENIVDAEFCRHLIPIDELLRLVNFYAKHERWEALNKLVQRLHALPHREEQLHKPVDLKMAACRKLMRSSAPRELTAAAIKSLMSSEEKLSPGFKKEFASWSAAVNSPL